MKRINWTEFFMGVAILASKRSRDENTQVGACIVKEKKIGRNDPCPCGSGKKYKKCCGANQ